jgi:hypothetical protein
VRAEIGELRVVEVEPTSASAVADRLAADFERETGRAADPESDNLVPNGRFAADDELRGVPVDWCAYSTTVVDPTTHTLRARGAPFGERPYLATGPVAIVPGRRYRAECRIRVGDGAVVFRAMDYDEIVVLGSSATAVPSSEFTARVLEFDAPPAAKAVRLWLAPVEPGASAEFELRAMQLEMLPEPPL